MSCSRRDFLIAGIGLVAAGCAAGTPYSTQPTAKWPRSAYEPTPLPPADHTVPSLPVADHVVEPTVPNDGKLYIFGRELWTNAKPVAKRLNPMEGVNRITIHHTGYRDILYTDFATTRQELEQTRLVHVRDRTWGDIGYHFCVDRAGRVWQGRPIEYQGAHVKNNNEHNIGIVALGNFDHHRPSDAQLKSVALLVAHLRRTYRVPNSRIQSHMEINPTKCPGKSFQPWVVASRARGAFV